MATIHASHIEKPKKKFSCLVLRAPVFNVYHHPERWEQWTVLAQTKDGAHKVASYHFYRSKKEDILIQ